MSKAPTRNSTHTHTLTPPCMCHFMNTSFDSHLRFETNDLDGNKWSCPGRFDWYFKEKMCAIMTTPINITRQFKIVENPMDFILTRIWRSHRTINITMIHWKVGCYYAPKVFPIETNSSANYYIYIVSRLQLKLKNHTKKKRAEQSIWS